MSNPILSIKYKSGRSISILFSNENKKDTTYFPTLYDIILILSLLDPLNVQDIQVFYTYSYAIRFKKRYIQDFIKPLAYSLKKARISICLNTHIKQKIRKMILHKKLNNAQILNELAKFFWNRSLKNTLTELSSDILLSDIRHLPFVHTIDSSHSPSIQYVHRYNVGPFTIAILDFTYFEKKYAAFLNQRTYLHLPLAIFMSKIIRQYDYKFHADRVIRMLLDELINHRCRLLERLIQEALFDLETDNFRSIFSHDFLTYIAFRSLRMHKYLPFLLDDNVQEFYCDRPGSAIYLDHQVYGRCVSNVKLDRRDIEALLGHLEIDTGTPIFDSSVSIKTDYITNLFRIRVVIDKYPLAIDGFTLDVRKHSLRYLTLNDLISRGSVSSDAAALLLTASLLRGNIFIIGEPGSGKTTLLNAIDTLLPRFFRKLYIEDVVESIPQFSENTHQVRLKVEPYTGHEKAELGKFAEIIKALHRKPDYVIMGELQTKEHFKAAFHAMSAGLRVLATCHSLGIRDFILRLKHIYDIPQVLIELLDIITVMRRKIYHNDTKFLHSIVCNSHNFKVVYIKTEESEEMNEDIVRELVKRLSSKNSILFQKCMDLYDNIREILQKNKQITRQIIEEVITNCLL